MVELRILTLVVTGSGPAFLVLEPLEEHVCEGKSRVVPIIVGPNEALGIGMAIEQTRFSRPMTHDIMLDALTSLDATVDHVFINDMKDGTFFARLVLSQHGRLIDLDARPSDAIALAVRQSASVFIDESVLERASYPYLFKVPYDEERAVEDFKDFLSNISPDDFA